MDRISRKQRQLERKYDNLRRYAAEEEKYKGKNTSDAFSTSRTTTRSSSSMLKVESSSSAVGSTSHTEQHSTSARSVAETTSRSPSSDPIKRYHREQQRQEQQQQSENKAASQTMTTSAAPVSAISTTTSERRSWQVCIAIQDYVPLPGTAPEEALPLEQGQIVEVLDDKNAANWLVRTKAQPPQTGWVPGSYFETPTKYYKQRRTTRELCGADQQLSEEQQALLKREQVYHDLLRTEEEFVQELRTAVDTYVSDFESAAAPQEVREHSKALALNLSELAAFHANVMVKGLQYYSDDSGKVGQTFVRLERDFEQHVAFMREMSNTQRMIQEVDAIQKYLTDLQSGATIASSKSYNDYLELVPARLKQYEDFFREIIKYSIRAKQDPDVMQKALELVQSVPKRAQEIEFTKNLLNYQGDVRRLGRIYRHDLFNVWEGDEQEPSEKYIFLFRNKLMLTERDMQPDPPLFRHYSTIRVDKYTVRQHTTFEDAIVFRPNEAGVPTFRIQSARDLETAEFVRKAWLKDISDMQASIGKLAEIEAEEVEEERN